MRVLTFGWEFPPYKSGGLGTACYDLAKGLKGLRVETVFVMPFAPKGAKANFVKLRGMGDLMRNVKIKRVDSILTPYLTSEAYEHVYQNVKGKAAKRVYGKNLLEEVKRYTAVAARIAKEEDHDIIHAHDWMTYEAGIKAKKISGKPLVVHLHATEFDRTGGNPDPRISHLEYTGMKKADRVITNSEFSKQNIIKHYKIKPSKIEVVHWAIADKAIHKKQKENREKIVLSLGRLTVQKGVDYLLEAASKVLKQEPDARFVIVGEGHMKENLIDMAAKLGIADRVTFTGWLKGDEVHRAFQKAKLFVMPSVAEPFGLVALESLKNGTPVIVSKTSGASEVLNHALKVDFWDVDEIANKITSVLKHPELHKTLKKNSVTEVSTMTLDVPARKIKEIYKKMTGATKQKI